MAARDKQNKPARDGGKPKKPPPPPQTDEEDYEDGDIATPKKDRDDEALQ